MEKVTTVIEIAERGSTDSAKANKIFAYTRKKCTAEVLQPKK